MIYFTGGTRYAYPYLMLIPVLFAAACYGLAGALVAALAAGLLMAAMPLDVSTQQSQSTLNWLVRLGLYLIIGGVAGGLFSLLNRAHATSERLAHTDPRTGMPNQVALHETLQHRLAPRPRQHLRVGLLLVRITDITDVLAALGPEAADALVAAKGNRLRWLDSRIVDVFRYSNSELCLLLDDIEISAIEKLATRLAEAGEENLVVNEVPIRVQLAMGSSWQSSSKTTADELIREARVALQAAMDQQCIHCQFSSDLARDKLQSIQLISRVRHDLGEGRFELHFQPKLRLSDGHSCGCEGLIRWRGSDGSLIPPGKFMPKVENTTLIAPVTRFVADRACHFANDNDGVVSINLSMRNLHDDALLDELLTLVESHGIPENRLEVEITESALMHDMRIAQRALERLRARGFRISIDDFGTGFSSFEYLQHLPITGLKIDRAFVKELEENPRAQRLMACMIDVGHALELEVTAEGVETLTQHRILGQLGCDQSQGFLYSKALPIDHYRNWKMAHSPADWGEK
ncbi:putative bifunctional diguanylate cyclase/phosphodiesterase [Halomonas campaniensis]|uniref:putative bifunctional diguanylate cyclase/phosphodiesterase n=1 Tax=Halomonas campaniensis TaxID=213554 RepID=UPI003970AC55